MARCIAWIYIFHGIFSAIWCLTLDPYPTVNITRYNSQSFNCSVDPNWNTVTYNYGTTNIALFAVQDGKCKDLVDQSSGRYTTDCDDSTRTFYLTINNITDVYNRRTIQCSVVNRIGGSSEIESTVYVQYPYLTVNVTRYSSKSFNCSVDPNWTAVTYNYGSTNIAFFVVQDGKCKDIINQSSGRYTTDCDDSTRKFYLTINNVTDVYNGKIMQCQVFYSTGNNFDIKSVINVQYQPTTSPNIAQTPDGPIIEGNKVTLTCTIDGGNPVATITWACDGASQITPTGSPSTVDAISSVELVTSKNNNRQICTCTGRHLLWTNDKTQQHTITVYYEPTSTPSILETPSGPINESSIAILTCDIKGGNPLATITWTCEGSSTINPTGSPPINTTTSSVELTVKSNDNGRSCTCIGQHPVWTTDKATSHTFDVRYQPTTLPTITQTPVGPIIEGNKVTLTCTIEGGNPVATITWSCNGATQITPTGIASTVDAISNVELVTSKHNNGQTCTCTGRHILWTNDRTHQHTITVYYFPTVNIMNMDPLDVVENITLKLVCQVLDANPTVNSFSWYKGSSTTPIGMESNFSISKVIRKDSGEYRCEGSNGIGENGVDTVYVNVLYNPEITFMSVIDGNEIGENNTAILQCKVESNPLSMVEWTFENKTLNEGKHDVLQSNFTIQRAKCVHTGFYMCIATNIINMNSYSDKKIVHLSVKCSPRRDTMFEPPENQIGLAPGQHLKMQIHIIAYPPPVVEWQFRSADNSTTETLSSNCQQTNMFKHTACFEKINVTEADVGQYSIFVHNGLGSNFSYLFNVYPQDKPTAPTIFYVLCKTTSAVVLWKSEFNGGSKQEFYVQYWRISQSSLSTLSPSIPDSVSTSVLLYTMNTLVPETIYIFQVITRNNIGDSSSKSMTCTTDKVQCQTNPASISQDSYGLFAAGISSLIIGLISIIFSVSFVFLCRSRLQKRDHMRTNDYTEFTTCTNSNPVVTDNYESLNTTVIGPADINETQTDRNVATYEECLPVTTKDHTYNNVHEQPKEKKKLKKKEEMYDNMKI